ncbi:MAG: cell wall metabolism sensor histidine kinase WalK [Patescibacteria group bacterium]|nr:cell wall metabolism sensor histidine kinase WalK [Patescibacteria group bacterium]
MFEHARIKLTLWYLVIIMAVSGFFSLIVYRGFTKELGRGFRVQALRGTTERRIVVQERNGLFRILPFVIYPDETPPEEFVEIINLAKHRFALQLLMINGGILMLAGTAGYFLAGKTLKPIEDMVEEQKRFVADASHELRTPLTSIKTEIEVALRDKKLGLKEAKELLKSNLTEVDKMKYFSDNLLALSRYEANGQDLLIEKVDLKEVARQAIERNMPQAKEKKISITEDVSEAVVKGNPQSLVELVSILINNAIKYSPKGKEIKVRVRVNKKHATIEVEDQGIGIDKKYIPHIFDRFYRADASRTRKGIDGCMLFFGLGLSIAKSIVDAHKGEIKVESEPGEGSTFKVLLPA